MRLAFIAALGILASSSAQAAEITDLPPNLRGDVHVAYRGAFLQAGLAESSPVDGTDLVYGVRNDLRHDVGLRAEFSPYTGVVITLGLPITAGGALSYPEAREMLFEPSDGIGSYRNGPALETSPTFTYRGLQGVWIGAAFAPFSEDYDRSLPVTSRIDIGLRTGAPKQTLYASGGASPGGLAFRMAAAFSVRRGKANPYAAMDWVQEFAAVSPVGHDLTAATVVDEAEVKDPTRIDVKAGAEFVALQKDDRKSRVAVDLYVTVGYRAFAQVASGYYLPSVLSTSRGRSVTTSEHLRFGGGTALDAHLNRWIGLRFGAEAAWRTPHRVESVYEVRTDAQTYDVGWSVALVGRVRTKKDEVVP